mgnify:CR=1 FL=1
MDETKNTPQAEEQTEPVQPEAEPEAVQETPQPDPLEELKEKLAAEHDSFLRLAAEYDNFRKRTQKERESLYQDAKADTVGKFLPVFDNLQRAMAQETADEAYKKGVEMTMQGFQAILDALNVTVYGAPGEAFDPTFHNAVMHVDDEALGENTIAEVFQTGFRMGDKVIRHAMVKVAN